MATATTGYSASDATHRGAAPSRATHASRATEEFSLSRPLTYLRGYERPSDLRLATSETDVPLDVDIIDTSWMDTNIGGPRHAYFNVNRWIIVWPLNAREAHRAQRSLSSPPRALAHPSHLP